MNDVQHCIFHDANPKPKCVLPFCSIGKINNIPKSNGLSGEKFRFIAPIRLVTREIPHSYIFCTKIAPTTNRSKVALDSINRNFRERIPYELQVPKIAYIWPIENVWAIANQNLDGKVFHNIAELKSGVRASRRRISNNKTTEQRLRYCYSSTCGIVTPRRDTSLICSFLREVWGGGKGEGNVPSVRASTQPDTTVGTVRFCTLYTKVLSRSKSRLCPFYILVWYLLWVQLIIHTSMYLFLEHKSFFSGFINIQKQHYINDGCIFGNGDMVTTILVRDILVTTNW